LLGNDTIDFTIESAAKMTFSIGDKITIIGRDYTLNIPAKERKISENHFQYDLQFEGVQYDLSRATYDVNIDTTGSDVQGDSLTGDMKLFLDVLIANISRIFPGKWVLGTYPVDTEAMTLTFGETDNCLSVLQTLCGKFNQEFDIAINLNGTRTINIGQAGKTFGFTFQYGRGRGIYDLTREKVSSSNITTRLKVYGSTKNITSRYRSSKLLLPGKTKPQSFLEDTAAIAKYGVWENTKNFDNIFPHRTGVVSALGDSVLKFIDSSMSFDLNEKEADGVTTKYLLSGTAAKVHFNTGKLAGYEFDIHSYDHATKTFKIKSQTDENDYTFPSETSSAFQIGVGDEYVLLDIAFPQSYIDTAEAELLAAGTEYLAQNCQPKVQYSLTVDKFFLASIVGADVESNIFWVGDYIPIKDADIDVDKLIRIKGFTRDLLTDYSYNLTISDLSVTKSAYNRIISDLIDIDKIITINNLKDPARARRNYLNAQEVLGMVFDPEGDYYTDKIKPESVDTVMLSVGAKSMQFGLVGTVFQPNYGGNKNRIVYKGGILTHYAIVDANKVPRSWTLTDGDQTLLSDGQAYYIYAKCEKAGSGGSILFSTSQITVESDPSYYHFWIGVINSVDASFNTRSIALTYGFTTINGKHITTGVVKSADGSCIIDLDGNFINFGDSNSSLSWNKNNDKTLRVKGILAQDSAGNESEIMVDRGTFLLSETYYKGNIVQYNGSTYKCKNDNTTNKLPTDTNYYTILASKGDTGATGPQGVPGTPGSNGQTYYTWIRYANDSAGNGISNDPSGKTYIGFAYNKTTPTESNTASDYTWSLIKGEKGDTGVQGPTGANGQTFYTWIKYSDYADGTNLYDTPNSNTKYIGIAVNKTIAAESSVKTDYVWSQFKGDTGATGNVIVSMFAKNGSMTIPPNINNTEVNPSGWSSNIPTATYLEYVWEIKAEKTVSGQLVGLWSNPVRISGIGGGSPVGGLDYDPTKTYVGSPIKCDVVKYNSVYYIARIDAGNIPAGTLPTNTSYYNSFGSSFESMATAFLWTESARIANFIYDNQKMVSQAQTNGVPNLSLDGISGLIKMLKAEIGRFKVLNGDIIGFDVNSNERSRFSAETLPSISELNQGWTIISDGDESYQYDTFELDDSIGLNKNSGSYMFDFNVSISQPCNIRIGTQGGSYSFNPYTSGLTINESNSISIIKDGVIVQQGGIGQIYYLSAGTYTFRWIYNISVSGMPNGTSIEASINMGYQGIEAQITPARTLIGSDGLYSIFSGGEYIYFKNGYGFEAKAGSYGIQVTTAGVKKWNGTSWILVNW
jgi:hypothetical protein